MEIKFHTLIKHEVLKAYLPYCNIVFRKKYGSKGKYGDLVYFETHAGDGEGYIDKLKKTYDGSALFAAKVIPKIPCYLVEKRSKNLKKLNSLLKNFDNVTLVKGDCNEQIDELLGYLPKGFTYPLAFGLIDPYGPSDICWKTIEKIIRHGKTELLILFPISGIIRNIENKSARESITKFYGSKDWIKIAEAKISGELDKHTANKLLAGLYRDKLKNYFKFVYYYPVYCNNVVIYHLIFTTNNKTGGKIIGHVIDKKIPEYVKSEFQRIKTQCKSLKEFL